MPDTFTSVALKMSATHAGCKELRIDFSLMVGETETAVAAPITAVFTDTPDRPHDTMTLLAVFLCGHMLGFLPRWLDDSLPVQAVGIATTELAATIEREFDGWKLHHIRIWDAPVSVAGYGSVRRMFLLAQSAVAIGG